MRNFQHNYAFDPSYAHSLESLLKIEPPAEPDDYCEFWQQKYQAVLATPTQLIRTASTLTHANYWVEDIVFASSNQTNIGGWLLTPKHQTITKGVIVGHGYGGRDAPDFNLPFTNAAVLFLCFYGLSRSRCAGISDNPAFHVLHNINDRERYVLRNCIQDIWFGATALIQAFPQVAGHLAYSGISFGGGIGAMAVAWDNRFQRAALNVPSFGNQTLRLSLPTTGSGAAVQVYYRCHNDFVKSNLIATLQYYDAALAAKYIKQHLHFALALFDPVVAPPGQFAIHNASTNTKKKLFVLDAGHFEYPGKNLQETQLFSELQLFFNSL